MKLSTIPIEKIDPAPYNPRVDLKPGDPRYERLSKSIDEFGMIQPLVWNRRSGYLVAGHQRLKILRARGEKDVEVATVDLPPDKERVLNLALNKIAGDWHEAKLAELLAALADVQDLDLEVTGFSIPDVEKLTADLREQLEDPAAEPIDDDASPITQPGDLIELGEHRLLCADAADRNSYVRLLDGQTVNQLFSDPPYGVDYRARRRPIPGKQPKKDRRAKRPLRGDSQGHAKYQRWLRPNLAMMAEHLHPGGAYYLWLSDKHLGFAADVLAESEVYTSTILTWAKNWPTPGYADYKTQTEHALYGWKRGAKRRFYGPKNASTLWQIPRERTENYLHPTQKPLELAERAIRYSSRSGELVFDPFLGSGTTLVAAAQLGRRCFGMEIEPKYCDVIVRRYIATVGPNAANPALVARYCTRKRNHA